MKPLLSLCGLLALFFINCSSGGDKFVGHWRTLGNKLVPKGYKVWDAKIEKVDSKNYHLIFYHFEPRDTIQLTYDQNTGILVGWFRETRRRISYLGDKDHILIGPLDTTRKNFLLNELERTKDNQ